MSAPPLPDAFGNYALQPFAEIVPPEAISWMPQTVGWLWLGIALLGFVLHRAWRAAQHWYRNRYRREAGRRLHALTATASPSEFVAPLNRILKITAVVAYSRQRVAHLSGEPWTAFLNQHCDQPPFNAQQLALLATAAYTGTEIDGNLQRQLLQAALVWVNTHTVDKPA